MPIYGKNPSKSRNQWTDFNETWYVASGTPAHHSTWTSEETIYRLVRNYIHAGEKLYIGPLRNYIQAGEKLHTGW